jgi:hypothetical protein
MFVESEDRDGRRTVHGEDRGGVVPPTPTVQGAPVGLALRLPVVRRAGGVVRDQKNIVIRPFIGGPGPNKRLIRPLGIVVSVEDPVGGDKIDRGGVAPAVGAFAEEGGLVETDTVPTVIRGDGE